MLDVTFSSLTVPLQEDAKPAGTCALESHSESHCAASQKDPSSGRVVQLHGYAMI